MKTYKQLSEEVGEMREIRGLVEVYEEIAAKKMQGVREAILAARAFFEGLAKLSEDVGADFSQYRAQPKDRQELKKRGSQLAPSVPINETAAVFIAADEGLYGDIIQRIFGTFLDFAKREAPDVFVVGRIGAELMESYAKGMKYQTMEVGDEGIDSDKFGEVTKQLLRYTRIVVFYGRFMSIVNQEPSAMTISGELLKDIVPDTDWAEKRMRYLYEPTLVDISQIFGNEILASTFEASLREAQLAKFASRMMSLDVAMERIDEKLETVGFERLKMRKRNLDKKQRQVICGTVVRSL